MFCYSPGSLNRVDCDHTEQKVSLESAESRWKYEVPSLAHAAPFSPEGLMKRHRRARTRAGTTDWRWVADLSLGYFASLTRNRSVLLG